MKKFIVVGVLIVGFSWGIFSIQRSPHFPQSIVQSSLGPVSARDPAAIRRMYDFSNLQGSALQTALQTRLIDAAQVVAKDDQKGIELGHFVVSNDKGEKVFACQKYSQVVMNFEAEGIAIAGAKPEMEVEGPCEMSENINKISPIWIPLARVLGEPVSDGEFDFMEGQKIRLRFKSVSDSWPKNWALKNIRLVSKTGEFIEVPNEFLRDRKNLNLSF